MNLFCHMFSSFPGYKKLIEQLEKYALFLRGKYVYSESREIRKDSNKQKSRFQKKDVLLANSDYSSFCF